MKRQSNMSLYMGMYVCMGVYVYIWVYMGVYGCMYVYVWAYLLFAAVDSAARPQQLRCFIYIYI